MLRCTLVLFTLLHTLFSSPLPRDASLTEKEWRQCEAFIRKEAQAYFLQGENYIVEKSNLPCPIERDPVTDQIFIHLKGMRGSYIGKGHNKVVTKSILYKDPPIVVARCEGGLPTYEEAAVIEKLQGLPGIVQYIAFIRREQGTRGDLFLEYYNVGSLKSYLLEKRQLTTSDLLQIISDLLTGLSGMHNRGFIHRDIHHGNIVFGIKRGKLRAALADFGLSIGVKDRMGVRPAVPNSASPPEFLLQDFALVDRLKSESYSIGIICYQLIFGKKPPWAKILNPNRIPDYSAAARREIYDQIVKSYRVWRKNRLPLRSTLRTQIATLAFDLLHPDPSQRLSVPKALKIIKKMKQRKISK